ncbi:MAG: hypothetical protein C0463_00215 [Idiomarina sp.]|nr:hypothetical protein [Idiomarina sp.]
MNKSIRYLTLAVLLITAVVLYSYGAVTSAFVFILLGLGIEALFWLGLLQSSAHKRTTKPT